MNKKLQVDNFLKFIKGKYEFYNGGKTEKFEITFLTRKKYQYWSRVYKKKCRIATFWGYVSQKKVDFFNIFITVHAQTSAWQQSNKRFKARKSKKSGEWRD